MKKYLCLALLWATFSFSTQAQTVTNIVKVDSLEMGNVVDYALVVKKQQNYDSVIFPDSLEFSPDFLVRSKRIFQPNMGTDSVVYQLQFFGSESGFIPNVPVTFVSGTDTTFALADKVPYSFKSKIAGEDAPPRPYKPIYQFAINIWPIILGILILVIIVYLIVRYMKSRPETKKEPEKVEIPPFINPLGELESALNGLKSSGFISSGDFSAFYVAMGDSIRKYYEDVYKFPALEETAREIHLSLESQMIDSQIIKESRAIFREAELVKFAKFEPTVDSAYQALEKSLQLLDLFHKLDRFKIERLRKEHEMKYAPHPKLEEELV